MVPAKASLIRPDFKLTKIKLILYDIVHTRNVSWCESTSFFFYVFSKEYLFHDNHPTYGLSRIEHTL